LAIRDRWEAVWQKLHAQVVPYGVLEELIRAYGSPNRFYHNLTHIQDCLSIFDQTSYLATHPEEVELAIWFHDSVYDTRRDNNEQRSAAWAEFVISNAGLRRDVAERVSHSILATCHALEITDTDGQVLVDVDLSILGREADIFWQYEVNIRKEYAWVPEGIFRQKRMEILRGFLERKYIYYHEKYRDMFEGMARINLEQAITRLSESSGADSHSSYAGR
jgi:predicted metal-dependent HD superfamily phosphohydrolase